MTTLERRFAENFERCCAPRTGDAVVVALSGGVDSVSLLHLLRFGGGQGVALTAAHFDHGMRPESGKDAEWCRGLSAAWNVGFDTERAADPPRDEAAAREARYAYLERARLRAGARWVLTAHHADDQAETVLFRILRGTGPAGLRGIRDVRTPSVARPFLPFWREEIEEYARRVGLVWRNDPTNWVATRPRTRLRLDFLPAMESTVARGARKSLVRLARLAGDAEDALAFYENDVLDRWIREEEPGRVELHRTRVIAVDLGRRGRLFGALARRLGAALDETGTRLALEFTNSGQSGSGVDLPGGLRLTRSFDRLGLQRAIRADGTVAGSDVDLLLEGPEWGRGLATLGGRQFSVSWGRTFDTTSRWCERFALEEVRFPVQLRRWRPGDRMRLPGGTRKLKKLFGESRIPVAERDSVPILAQADDQILWAAGLARADLARTSVGHPTLSIGIDDVDES